MIQRTGRGRSGIYRDVAAGTFPRPVKQGKTISFVSAEVDAWIRARIAERDAG